MSTSYVVFRVQDTLDEAEKQISKLKTLKESLIHAGSHAEVVNTLGPPWLLAETTKDLDRILFELYSFVEMLLPYVNGDKESRTLSFSDEIEKRISTINDMADGNIASFDMRVEKLKGICDVVFDNKTSFGEESGGDKWTN